MTVLLKVDGLTKRYGKRTVLGPISFELERGDSVVLAGPNGSGKSTLLRLLAGILPADGGAVTMEEGAGAMRRIGYVPERMPLLRFSPEEYLRHMGAVRGMNRQEVETGMNRLLEFCRLESTRHTQIRHFSKGMLQKVGIMQALLGAPELLLLDEPFSGLDVEAQEDLVRLLQRLRKQGQALLFASHEPELAERLADRMLLLDASGGYGLMPVAGKKEPDMQVQAVYLEAEAVMSLIADVEGLRYRQEDDGFRFRVPERLCDGLLLRILELGGSIKSVVPEEKTRKDWTGGSSSNRLTGKAEAR